MSAGPVLLLAAATALVAAAAHAYMFAVESVLFTRPATLAMMEVEPAHAGAVRLWAYHQGIYNLLLALVAATGSVTLLLGPPVVATTLLVTSSTCMLAAALALLGADPRRQRLPGFTAQALPPLATLVVLLLA